MNAKYYITNDLAVDRRFECKLAGPEGEGDQATWLYAAPEVGAKNPSAIIYMATNGDPVYVGALGADGWGHLTEEETQDGEPTWLYCLQAHGMVGDSGTEAKEFIEELMEAR